MLTIDTTNDTSSTPVDDKDFNLDCKEAKGADPKHQHQTDIFPDETRSVSLKEKQDDTSGQNIKGSAGPEEKDFTD